MSLLFKASGTDLRVVSAKLRKAGADKAVRRQFSRNLRAAAAPMVPAVRASIAAIPVKEGGRSSGLRKRMQKATRLKVRTVGKSASVQILVDPKKMPDGQKALPQYMEGAEGHTRWRHPVFAPHGTEPIIQQPPKPYFFKTVRRLGVTSRLAAAKVVRDITKEIT
jgi:hypothetical protein